MYVKKLVGYFLLILFLGGVLLVAGDYALAYSGKLCRGLFIADVSVGGLPVAEAEMKVAAALKDKQSKPVAALRFEDKTWPVDWDFVSGSPDASHLVRQAYGIGRAGNLMARLREQIGTSHGGAVVPLELMVDRDKLRILVINAAASVDREAVDASIEEHPAGLIITADRAGRKTDVESTMVALELAAVSGSATPVSLVAKEVQAAIRAQDLKGIDSRLASFTTTYDASDASRSRNIQVAAANLTGVLVRAGETLSFNDRIGLRTPERGYQMAPTLSSTGVVMDWGGGVCQVSSTLYNAALLAGFSVIERSPHYQPPSYVPLGQDATVADGQIDLKLKNVRKQAVYLQSVAEAGILEIRLYGKREQGEPTIHIESTEKTVQLPHTIMLQDPKLLLGQEIVESEGRNGFVVTVQRIHMQGQKEIKREKISTDEFDGTDRIVRVGTLTTGGKIVK